MRVLPLATSPSSFRSVQQNDVWIDTGVLIVQVHPHFHVGRCNECAFKMPLTSLNSQVINTLEHTFALTEIFMVFSLVDFSFAFLFNRPDLVLVIN